jgi:hypothetical protein
VWFLSCRSTPGSPLDILDDLFRFFQAPRPGLAVRLDGLDLFTALERVDNFGREAFIGLEFDIPVFHKEIEFHLDPAQCADPLSNVVNSFSERRRQRYSQRYCG